MRVVVADDAMLTREGIARLLRDAGTEVVAEAEDANSLLRHVRLARPDAAIVDNRAMPDVNLQYVIAVALVDGTLSFEDSHSHERMQDPQIRAARERVQLVADRALMVPDAPRSGLVEVTLRDGRTVSHFTRHPPGTKENPLDTSAVNEKARGLIEPVLGPRRTSSSSSRTRRHSSRFLAWAPL